MPTATLSMTSTFSTRKVQMHSKAAAFTGAPQTPLEICFKKELSRLKLPVPEPWTMRLRFKRIQGLCCCYLHGSWFEATT
jgi:hypothetical protein|mmetsp:Transcript_37828/g.62368  ORF Transcript_37828/g.62368 Transcript_37828/m.62368 type:complete len:80 (-) Transcript_37828:780-1019(-)